MEAVEEAVYCHGCALDLFMNDDTVYADRNLVLNYPAFHDENDKGRLLFIMEDICRGCGKEVNLREASKVIRMEVEK